MGEGNDREMEGKRAQRLLMELGQREGKGDKEERGRGYED